MTLLHQNLNSCFHNNPKTWHHINHNTHTLTNANVRLNCVKSCWSSGQWEGGEGAYVHLWHVYLLPMCACNTCSTVQFHKNRLTFLQGSWFQFFFFFYEKNCWVFVRISVWSLPIPISLLFYDVQHQFVVQTVKTDGPILMIWYVGIYDLSFFASLNN